MVLPTYNHLCLKNKLLRVTFLNVIKADFYNENKI